MLKRESIHPLYKQLMEELIEQIHIGIYKVGSQIPTEPELAKMYDVSRITVRRTIEEMCKKGYLVKRQGKGTFVKPQKLFHVLQQTVDQSFSDACITNNYNPSAHVVSCNLCKISSQYAASLNMTESKDALCLQRLFTADDIPIMLVDIYMDPNQYPGFDQKEVDKTAFFPYICQQYQVKPSKDRSFTLTCMNAPWDIAEKLGISAGDPVLLIDRLELDEANKPLFYSRQYIVGSRYTINF